jgi:hypothetical protein
MVSKRWTWREKRGVTVRSFVCSYVRSSVRLLVRSFVRSFVVVEKREWQCGGKKVMTRGRRSKIEDGQKKIILRPIGVWNPECKGTHCWRSVWTGVVLSSLQVESHLWPALKSGTQRVPRHISPYCQQNSGYAGWFCPEGSVCSISLWKVSYFLGSICLVNGINNLPPNLT